MRPKAQVARTFLWMPSGAECITAGVRKWRVASMGGARTPSNRSAPVRDALTHRGQVALAARRGSSQTPGPGLHQRSEAALVGRAQHGDPGNGLCFSRGLGKTSLPGAGDLGVVTKSIAAAKPGSRPGSGSLGLGLIVADGRLVFQREADIVEAFDQAALAEWVHLELYHASVGAADFLVFQIHGDGGIGAAVGVVHELVEVLLRHLDWQDAVLKAVVEEYVGERGGDD